MDQRRQKTCSGCGRFKAAHPLPDCPAFRTRVFTDNGRPRRNTDYGTFAYCWLGRKVTIVKGWQDEGRAGEALTEPINVHGQDWIVVLWFDETEPSLFKLRGLVRDSSTHSLE